MNDLSYEETVELEKNIKFKNEANQVYQDFLNHFKLNIKDYKSEYGMFEIWSDSNNASYIDLKDGVFYYRARYLHESYDVTINPGYLFGYIKNKYRGYEHFKSDVLARKKQSEIE